MQKTKTTQKRLHFQYFYIVTLKQ